MTHRIFNLLLAAAFLGLFVGAQLLDPQDFESDMQRERREWLAHAKSCQTKYGGLQASAEYEGDQLVCVTRRGEVLR